MAKTKKVITDEVVETIVEKTVDNTSEFAKLLELYKAQNPVKYELKKVELLKKLNQ